MKVLHCRRDQPIGRTIYCGRGTPWGNPFVLGKHGDRATVIARFHVYAVQRLKSESKWLDPLLNADALSCWCSPQPCHCDIIVYLIRNLRFERRTP